jgi:hypothetical protein
MPSYFHEPSVPLSAPEVDGFRGHYPPGANVTYGLTGYGSSQPLAPQASSQPYTAYHHQPTPFQAPPREAYMPPPPPTKAMTPTPTRHPDTFDREQPLFERLVPVSVQEAGVEEKTKLLMVRVLASNGSYNADGGVKSVNDTSRRRTAQKSPFNLPASTNCVRVEVTDDRNHFFLHTLEVGERAFHELKLQQRMVIDFTAFAGKLIEMLDYCCGVGGGGGEGNNNNDANRGEEHGGERKAPPSRSSPSSIQFGPGFMEGSGGGGQGGHAHSCRQREASMGGHPAPRFTSVLRVKAGEMSQFCIIEVNSFNHVTHLSLSLKVHIYTYIYTYSLIKDARSPLCLNLKQKTRRLFLLLWIIPL